MTTSVQPSINHDLLGRLKEQDSKMNQAMQFIVPTYYGTDAAGQPLYAPSVYPNRREAPIIDKVNYSKLLTGKDATPMVNITEEDINAVKDKAWMATMWDFDDWVGRYFKPQENPANKELLQKIYPQYFESKLQAIENWHNFKKQVETIKIKGASNFEELFTQYRLGWPSASAQGVNEGAQQYASTQSMPTFVKGDDALVRDATANFQRGIFNINSGIVLGKSLYGYPHSAYSPGSFELGTAEQVAAGRAAIKGYNTPFAGGYPTPAAFV